MEFGRKQILKLVYKSLNDIFTENMERALFISGPLPTKAYPVITNANCFFLPFPFKFILNKYMWTVLSSFNSVLSYTEQWRIQGRGPGGWGGGRSLICRPNGGPKGRKGFSDRLPPLLSQVLDDRSLTLSEGLDPPLLKHAHCM